MIVQKIFILKKQKIEQFFPNKYRLSGSMVNHQYELENLLNHIV